MVKRRKMIKDFVKEVEDSVKKPVEKLFSGRFDKVVSTGSTLLDLAISGGRVRGGGIPGGIIFEIFGPPGTGKTGVLAEIGASVQMRGGQIAFLDPEARLDREYSEMMGIPIPKEFYCQPDFVSELFKFVNEWKPKIGDVTNVILADSLTALSTELQDEGKDQYGMKRAKDFSEGLRHVCRKIAKSGWVIACSNQVREGPLGESVPGGKGIPFYASVRVRVGPHSSGKYIKGSMTTKAGYKIEKKYGIRSICIVKKNTVDDPFREVPVTFLFGYGIDDVRENIQYVKEVTKEDRYDCLGKEYRGIEQAIKHIEDNNLMEDLRNKVIDLWEDIEKRFKEKSIRERKRRI